MRTDEVGKMEILLLRKSVQAESLEILLIIYLFIWADIFRRMVIIYQPLHLGI